MKQYLDGISVNDDVLGRDNPLFVVNDKVNVNLDTFASGDDTIAKPTVVEAATVARTKSQTRSLAARDR